jgi:hypothetical protein
MRFVPIHTQGRPILVVERESERHLLRAPGGAALSDGGGLLHLTLGERDDAVGAASKLTSSVTGPVDEIRVLEAEVEGMGTLRNVMRAA